jgi:Tripartite tricarboxylate transporter TctB family.
MSIQRIFSIFVAIISLFGISGSLQLSMTRAKNIGPGVMPLTYSIILLVISVMLFFSDKDQPKLKWRNLFKSPTSDAYIFYGLNFLMFFIMYFFGTVPAMFIFCVLSMICLKRQKIPMAIIFSVSWVASLYVIFVVLLKVPFETGILMKLR